MIDKTVNLAIISTIDRLNNIEILKIGELRKVIKNDLVGDIISFKFSEITINKNCTGNRHFGIGEYYHIDNGDEIKKIIGPINSRRLLNKLLKEFYQIIEGNIPWKID